MSDYRVPADEVVEPAQSSPPQMGPLLISDELLEVVRRQRPYGWHGRW
jgi:hypothetical protein